MTSRGTFTAGHESAEARLPDPGSRLRAGALPPRPAVDRGATLLETVLAAGIFVVVIGMTVPLVTAARHQQRLRTAASYLGGRIMLARADAARNGAAIGIRFVTRASGVGFRSHLDGNGNGVRTADIRSGRDRPLETEVRIGDLFAGVRFALSPAVPPIGATSPSGEGADPVRLGASDILTVTPLGTATSGTLYLRNREGHQAAVRVLGATARVQIHHFDFQTGRWRAR